MSKGKAKPRLRIDESKHGWYLRPPAGYHFVLSWFDSHDIEVLLEADCNG